MICLRNQVFFKKEVRISTCCPVGRKPNTNDDFAQIKFRFDLLFLDLIKFYIRFVLGEF